MTASSVPFAPARRPAFSLLEVVAALAVVAILAIVALPRGSTLITHSRVNRAATVVAGDLEYAFSLAARQRVPVFLNFNPVARSYSITSRAGKLLHRRSLGYDGDYALQTLTAASDTIEIFPTGLATGPNVVTLGTGSYNRQVVMTRAGQVRVVPRT